MLKKIIIVGGFIFSTCYLGEFQEDDKIYSPMDKKKITTIAYKTFINTMEHRQIVQELR